MRQQHEESARAILISSSLDVNVDETHSRSLRIEQTVIVDHSMQVEPLMSEC